MSPRPEHISLTYHSKNEIKIGQKSQFTKLVNDISMKLKNMEITKKIFVIILGLVPICISNQTGEWKR